MDFGSLYFRYINSQDIVTRVPPRKLGYWHTGNDRFIDSKSNIHDGAAWWQIFLDQIEVGVATLREMQAGVISAPLVSDHFMANYIARIEKNVSRASPGVRTNNARRRRPSA